MLRFTCLALASLITFGCASVEHTSLAPLVVLGAPDATYQATIGGPSSALEVVPLEATIDRPLEERAGEPVMEVLVDMLRFDREQLQRLVGWTHGARVWTTSLEGAQAVVNASQQEPATRIEAPRVMLLEGQRGTIQVANQIAYVSHFEVEADGPAMVADPTIQVAMDGSLIEMVGNFSGPKIDLQLVLRFADLERPFKEMEVQLPGSATPGTIQLPIAAVQTISTEASVGPDECLVLIANAADDPDAYLVTLVHAQRIEG